VVAPLDRSGATAGTVTLHVERLRPAFPSRGVMLLVAGGPGQASAAVFDLASGDYDGLFPGYTLVAFDPRGTGRSDALRCPALEGELQLDADLPQRVARCARQIGPRRRFYTTRDHAADVEAVREALGVERIAIWGTSYGTQLAVAYAARYPRRVERLLLDSVVAPEGLDPYNRPTLRAIPRALASLCAASGCRSMPRLGEDVVVLANRLARKPLQGVVGGRRVRVTGQRLIELVVDSDLNPALAAELPSAIVAARGGRPQPLLRLASLGIDSFPDLRELFSAAVLAATICGDSRVPWSAGAGPAEREQALRQAIAALPPGSTGRFGAWAARSGTGTAEICRGWPDTPAPAERLQVPDVPVLAVAGELDMRTPVSSALAVARRFPRGRVLVVPGAGHSVLTAVRSCANSAVRAWLRGSRTPSRCPRVTPLVPTVPRVPRSLADVTPPRGTAGRQGRTLGAVMLTLAEARAATVLAVLDALVDGFPARGTRLPGVSGGLLVFSGGEIRLRDYSFVPGVALSGRIEFERDGLTGVLAICGPAAARGMIVLEEDGRRRVTWSPLRAVRSCA
jgi:pimeloyl-ACP methyl ester carboxylesterase